MKRLVFLVLVVACGGQSGPSIDQKGKFLVYYKGKKSVVDNVEYGFTKEMTDPDVMGRKDADGTRHALVKKARFVTKKFSTDSGDITADLTFDMGKASGTLQIGDKPCEVTMLSWGHGSVEDTKYEGFIGACKLDGDERDFTIGLVK